MLSSIPPKHRNDYRKALNSVYRRRVHVALLNNGNDNGTADTVANLTDYFLDGAITVDANQDVTRSASIQILDWKHQFGFDADTYQGHELGLTRQLRIWWVIDSPLLSKRLSIPVHTGPVNRLQRDGALVTIEAQGREAYGLTPSHRTLTLKKGIKRTDAIKTILSERMGEKRLGAIPDLPAKLPDKVVVGPKDQPWKKAQKIAHSLDRMLMYGADGIPYLRPRPEKPNWLFHGDGQLGDGTGITSPLVSAVDLQKVKNHIKVTGATPKGKKHPVSAQATADKLHRLSPWSLGPPGAPMWLIDEISNQHLRTDKECKDVADRALAKGLRLLHDTSFNAAPVPHLEPYDLVRVLTDEETATSRIETFTLPLGAGGDMAVGYLDPYKLTPRRHHKHGHHAGSGAG